MQRSTHPSAIIEREDPVGLDEAAGGFLPENEDQTLNNSAENLNAEDRTRRRKRTIHVDKLLNNTPTGPNGRVPNNQGNVAGNDIRRLENLIMQLSDQCKPSDRTLL